MTHKVDLKLAPSEQAMKWQRFHKQSREILREAERKGVDLPWRESRFLRKLGAAQSSPD